MDERFRGRFDYNGRKFEDFDKDLKDDLVYAFPDCLYNLYPNVPGQTWDWLVSNLRSLYDWFSPHIIVRGGAVRELVNPYPYSKQLIQAIDDFKGVISEDVELSGLYKALGDQWVYPDLDIRILTKHQFLDTQFRGRWEHHIDPAQYVPTYAYGVTHGRRPDSDYVKEHVHCFLTDANGKLVANFDIATFSGMGRDFELDRKTGMNALWRDFNAVASVDLCEGASNLVIEPFSYRQVFASDRPLASFEGDFATYRSMTIGAMLRDRLCPTIGLDPQNFKAILDNKIFGFEDPYDIFHSSMWVKLLAMDPVYSLVMGEAMGVFSCSEFGVVCNRSGKIVSEMVNELLPTSYPSLENIKMALELIDSIRGRSSVENLWRNILIL